MLKERNEIAAQAAQQAANAPVCHTYGRCDCNHIDDEGHLLAPGALWNIAIDSITLQRRQLPCQISGCAAALLRGILDQALSCT